MPFARSKSCASNGKRPTTATAPIAGGPAIRYVARERTGSRRAVHRVFSRTSSTRALFHVPARSASAPRRDPEGMEIDRLADESVDVHALPLVRTHPSHRFTVPSEDDVTSSRPPSGPIVTCRSLTRNVCARVRRRRRGPGSCHTATVLSSRRSRGAPRRAAWTGCRRCAPRTRCAPRSRCRSRGGVRRGRPRTRSGRQHPPRSPRAPRLPRRPSRWGEARPSRTARRCFSGESTRTPSIVATTAAPGAGTSSDETTPSTGRHAATPANPAIRRGGENEGRR